MTDQALQAPARAERRRPRRRWNDVNPLAAGVLLAAIFAVLFHLLPGDDASHAIRVVLTGLGVAAAFVLLAALLLQGVSRPTGGYSRHHHPGRRSGDRP